MYIQNGGKVMRISLRWTTMPIPDEGSTFAFEAKITRHEFLQLIEDNNLDFDVYKEGSKDVYKKFAYNRTIYWL